MVLSHPCHQPINRSVYRELAIRHQIPVHLIVPRQLNVGGICRDTPQTAPDAYDLTMLNLSGSHGRLQYFENLAPVVSSWSPTHILVDNDPASLMTWQAAKTAPKAQLWALTAENLMPRYGRDLLAGIRSLNPRLILGPLLTWSLRKLVHPKVHRVFTLSSDGTRVMERMGFQEKATQIPLGFDPQLFQIQPPSQRADTRLKLGLNQTTIAYFGRLTPEKGLHLLIQALASMQDLNWQFLVDHFSDYRTAYTRELEAQIAAAGISHRVVYFDSNHTEMPNFMNAADIVVLPSVSTPKWKEQYGRVLPEAMACGRVVVGSDSGAIPELVGSFGHIVPEGDASALALKLRQLLASPSLESEGQNASTYAHSHLSLVRQAEIWASLLTGPS